MTRATRVLLYAIWRVRGRRRTKFGTINSTMRVPAIEQVYRRALLERIRKERRIAVDAVPGAMRYERRIIKSAARVWIPRRYLYAATYIYR